MDAERIAAKLKGLRDLDKQQKLFGAQSHHYAFHPKLDETALTRFEAEHQVLLPEDYRQFLETLGNGGAGPFYGIFKLGEMDDGFEHSPWLPGFVGTLSAPFPHTTEWNLPAERLEPPESFESDEDEDRWHEEVDAIYWDPKLVDGAFPICHHGCALRTWLVVTGDERGHVWYDGRADGGGLCPHLDPEGKHLSFASWYEAWLDGGLAELKRKTK